MFAHTVSPLHDDYAFEPHLPPIVEGNDERAAETVVAVLEQEEEEVDEQEDDQTEDAAAANVSVRERSTSGPGKKNNKKVSTLNIKKVTF